MANFKKNKHFFVFSCALNRDGRTYAYLGDQKRPLVVNFSLCQGESPGCSSAQRYADVISSAHDAQLLSQTSTALRRDHLHLPTAALSSSSEFQLSPARL